jgi:hypothetical protein
MKKILSIIAVFFCLLAQAQSITIPVVRVSQSADSTLFNFNPYTVQLSVVGGASFGNINFYYKITDSVANAIPHLTPFNQVFTRSNIIDGTISFPNAFFIKCFDEKNKPIITIFNKMLEFMDMKVDTTRNFVIQ